MLSSASVSKGLRLLPKPRSEPPCLRLKASVHYSEKSLEQSQVAKRMGRASQFSLNLHALRRLPPRFPHSQESRSKVYFAFETQPLPTWVPRSSSQPRLPRSLSLLELYIYVADCFNIPILHAAAHGAGPFTRPGLSNRTPCTAVSSSRISSDVELQKSLIGQSRAQRPGFGKTPSVPTQKGAEETRVARKVQADIRRTLLGHCYGLWRRGNKGDAYTSEK